jgi:hypothetical protein
MSVRLAALAFGALVVGSVIIVDPAGLAPFGPSKWLAVSTLALITATLSLRRGSTRCQRQSWWMWVALLVLLTLSALVNGDAKVRRRHLVRPDRDTEDGRPGRHAEVVVLSEATAIAW